MNDGDSYYDPHAEERKEKELQKRINSWYPH